MLTRDDLEYKIKCLEKELKHEKRTTTIILLCVSLLLSSVFCGASAKEDRR